MYQKLEQLRAGVHNLTCHAANMGYDGKLMRAIAIDQMRIGEPQTARMTEAPLAEYAKIINFVLLNISAEEFNAKTSEGVAFWYREATAQPMPVVDAAPKDFFDGVAMFNIAAGVIGPAQVRFDAKLVAFYTGVQCEELAEKLRAIFCDAGMPVISGLEQLGHDLKNGVHTVLVDHADRRDLLDADIDLQVVSEGAILASGADGNGGRGEVNRSNLAKIVDGKVIRDPVSGKILKPEGWTPPNLEPFVCKL